MLADPLDRRRFLTAMAKTAAGVAWAGAGFGAQLASAGTPPDPAEGEPGLQVLRRPIVLRKGEVLADKRYELAPDFDWTSSMAAIYAQVPDVTIRNVHLSGSASWLPRWNVYNEPAGAPRGINSGTCGIRLQRTPRARIENVRIEGFPRGGIEGFGLDETIIRDVTIERCFFGVIVSHYELNRSLLVERVQARDLWGPGPGRWPGIGGGPSRQRPGGFTGGDGLALHSLRSSIVRDCEVTGEQFASLKLVNPQDTEVSGIRGIGIMVQGTSDLEWKIDKTPSRNTRVRNCVIDKSLGAGPSVDSGNGMQISWHVNDLSIEDCTFRAAGQDGHAIQFAVDVHGRVTGCTFDGWNGKRGVTPAHALELVDGSTVNPDFAQVNTFINQKRIVLGQ